MTIRLLTALSLATVLGGSLTACAPPGGDVSGPDSVDSEEDNLGSSQRSYVTIRRDFRKCSWPMCGGWFVQDVNRKNPSERYVSALEFSGPDADAIRGQAEAGGGEVVLYGKLADLAEWDDPAMKVFRVSAAWRGMPGAVVQPNSTYYAVAARDPQINCFVAPCSNVAVTPLHKTKVEMIDRVTTDAFGAGRVNGTWLGDRLMSGGIAAGVLAETDENAFPGGPERILDADQIFIPLPEAAEEACPLSKPACGDLPVIYSYDSELCVVLQGCLEGEGMMCTQQVPDCGDGYDLISFGGSNGCTQHMCEPAWVREEPVVEGGEG